MLAEGISVTVRVRTTKEKAEDEGEDGEIAREVANAVCVV
jgi:hypothetical protein